MKMRLLAIPILLILIVGMLAIPQSDASSPPSVHFTTSPVTTWYNQTPYEYAASISAPYNWTLKTNASLHMSGGSVVNDTASQTVFGILDTGSYWVNISISYHNSTNATTLLIYQNFTLTILNKPYIYSTPETFFYPDSTYNYTYEINQGNITNYSSGFSLNKTTHTLSQYLTGNSYSFFLTVSDKNGTYTQEWGVSSNNLSFADFGVKFGSGTISIYAPLSGIGVNNTTVFIGGIPIIVVPVSGISYSYTFNMVSSQRYEISTTSSQAQPVTLVFGFLVPGYSYGIYMIGSGGSTLIVNGTVPASGEVSMDYDPATMPLDPTFEASVSPPPPYEPIQPTPPSNFFPSYIFDIMIAIAVVGVAFGVYELVRRR